MQNAAIVLAFAALGGLTIAIMGLNGVPRPPMWTALGHGAIAATGMILLIMAAFTVPLPTLSLVALGVLIMAALGGSYLFLGFHLQGKPLPVPIVLAHGALAATGYGLLLLTIFG